MLNECLQREGQCQFGSLVEEHNIRVEVDFVEVVADRLYDELALV